MSELDSSETSARRRGRWLVIGLILAGVCMMFRLPGLMALPIFCDEAIYLRWAQLIRGDRLMVPHPWVSLADPKPPLHFWIIAFVYNWTWDPLLAARLISVACGALSVPLMMLIGIELGYLMTRKDSLVNGRVLGLMSAIMAIFCPFLAFHQRLATADALFLCESLAIVWLGLFWARKATGDGSRWVSWTLAGALGVFLGAGLMTRQGLSYTIFAMPAVAWAIHAWGVRRQANLRTKHETAIASEPSLTKRSWKPWAVTVLQYVMMCVIAGAIWLPYLTTELQSRAAGPGPASGLTGRPASNEQLFRELKRRVYFREEFTQASAGRVALASRNAGWTFVPRWNEDGLTSGWLWAYLTPPVYVMCLLGMIHLAWREWRILWFLGFWALLMLGPVIVLGNLVYSRYVLAGVPPLLFAGGYLLADLMGAWLRRYSRRSGTALAGILVILALVTFWPIRELTLQAAQWWKQTLTVDTPEGVRGDRYQYVTGWPAGYATRHAVTYLANVSLAGDIVVITGGGWGTPADAVWVYLAAQPRVHMYYLDNVANLRPSTLDGTFRLRDEKWLYPAARAVRLPADGRVPVLVISREKVNGPDGRMGPAAEILRRANPNLGDPVTFKGVMMEDGTAGEGVLIFPLRPAVSAAGLR